MNSLLVWTTNWRTYLQSYRHCSTSMSSMKSPMWFIEFGRIRICNSIRFKKSLKLLKIKTVYSHILTVFGVLRMRKTPDPNTHSTNARLVRLLWLRLTDAQKKLVSSFTSITELKPWTCERPARNFPLRRLSPLYSQSSSRLSLVQSTSAQRDSSASLLVEMEMEMDRPNKTFVTRSSAQAISSSNSMRLALWRNYNKVGTSSSDLSVSVWKMRMRSSTLLMSQTRKENCNDFLSWRVLFYLDFK